MSSSTKSLTEGPLAKQILLVSLPLVLSNLLQVLFNMSDVAVVGRLAGSTALGSVGSTSIFVTLFTGFLIGLSNGINVLVARFYGARHASDVEKTVHSALLVSLAAGILLLLVGLLGSPALLHLLNTKEDLYPGAVLYLRVYFLGMVPNVVYNMGTGVLRAIGDFRRPLYFLIAASGCNIVLDLLLVLVFHLDVAGVAIATICSQLLSAVLVVVALLRSEMTPYQLFPRQLHIHPEPMRGILHIGVPTALQSVMYSASNIVIQAAINSFGTDTVRFLAPCYITYILIELIAGAVRGAGKSVGPMLIDVFGVCGLRLAWLFLVVPVHHTLTVVMFSYPITWTVTSVALLIYYFFGRWLKEPSPAP